MLGNLGIKIIASPSGSTYNVVQLVGLYTLRSYMLVTSLCCIPFKHIQCLMLSFF